MSDEAADRIALAWRELRRGAASTTLRSQLLGPAGPRLEQAQLDALEIIAGERDGMRMSDFADAMHVEPSTATRAVDRLERLGLAQRRQADGDRRFVEVSATPEGLRMFTRIQKVRATGMERLLEPFDPDEREAFAAYLERFVDSIQDLVDEITGRDPDR